MFNFYRLNKKRILYHNLAHILLNYKYSQVIFMLNN